MRGGFRCWLEHRYPAKVAATRSANVRRVEAVVGDLDVAYGRDQLEDVLVPLSYSRSEQNAGLTDRSGIVIDGDVYNGLATLKAATKLYREFRSTPSAEDREATHV